MKKRERLYFIAHSFVFLRENRAADILLLSNLAMICFFSSFFIGYAVYNHVAWSNVYPTSL